MTIKKLCKLVGYLPSRPCCDCGEKRKLLVVMFNENEGTKICDECFVKGYREE